MRIKLLGLAILIVSLAYGLSYGNCGNDKGVGQGCDKPPVGPPALPPVTTTVINQGGQQTTVLTDAGGQQLQTQIDKMNEFHTYFEPEIQVFDTVHFTGSVSDRIWIQDSGRNQAVTLHLKYRLGPDHNDEQVKALKAELGALRAELARLER